jgi:uncharacterized protein YdeI (BOF family)
MKRSVAAMLLAAVLTGCFDRGPKTLGTMTPGAAASVAALEKTSPESPVVVRGTMTKKCPVAGCWFMLHDDTGTIKVDTRNAGFVVVDVPLNTSMAVAGRIVTNGAERLLDATGLRY